MAIIVKANGHIENVEPKNKRDFSLEELQKIVGGYIEIVPLDNDQIIVLNEEGKLMGLKVNEIATTLYHEVNRFARSRMDFIVGDVLVCNSEQVK